MSKLGDKHVPKIEYFEPGLLQDEELSLHLEQFVAADPKKDYLPAYYFQMIHQPTKAVMGKINFRAGNTANIVLYRGHIGYSVQAEFRGHHYAARSVKLLLPLAIHYQLEPLWITCNPENAASRRTCELVGAKLVEIINIPPDEDMYHQGIRQKCRYRLSLSAFSR